MVVMIIILSILNKTIFSLLYILLLSYLAFSSALFLNVEKARKSLLPLLRNVVIPFMLFEIFV